MEKVKLINSINIVPSEGSGILIKLFSTLLHHDFFPILLVVLSLLGDTSLPGSRANDFLFLFGNIPLVSGERITFFSEIILELIVIAVFCNHVLEGLFLLR